MLTQKLLIILCTISIIFSFAGCTRQSEPNTQNENSTQAEQNQGIQQPMESQAKANSPATEQNPDSSVHQEKSQEQSVNEDHTNEEEYTEEEPTEEELTELFDKAMYEINDLATTEIDYLLSEIFDGDIECDYSNQVTINGVPYQWTSRRYSELVDYYSQTFTGEALYWLLTSNFADVDGVLYGFAGGGASGILSKAISIEKLEGNTYQATYENTYVSGSTEECSTTFTIEKTNDGYRVSDIAHRPYFLSQSGHRIN